MSRFTYYLKPLSPGAKRKWTAVAAATGFPGGIGALLWHFDVVEPSGRGILEGAVITLVSAALISFGMVAKADVLEQRRTPSGRNAEYLAPLAVLTERLAPLGLVVGLWMFAAGLGTVTGSEVFGLAARVFFVGTPLLFVVLVVANRYFKSKEDGDSD